MSGGPASRSLRELYDSECRRLHRSADPAQLGAVAKLDDLRARLIAREPHSLLRNVLRRRAAPAPTPGLYLWGGVGRGKTWLMDLFYRSLPFPERRRRHFHRFMHDVHSELRKLEGRESPLDVVAEGIAGETRILCFDELFVTDIGDAMILGGLLGALFHRGVSLVATSNLPPHELYKDGLQRQRFVPAIRLLEKHTEVLNVDGGVDYRLRQLSQAGLYLSSTDVTTGQRLEELFVELSDEQGTTPGTIEIEERRIAVVRDSENVVWFEFDAICEGPRSQNDYIEIAREYPSVIVSGVPVLDETRENAARRFVALVDEFYDRGVNLVLSAAAPPQGLYRGTRLRHEFQRTVSRLIEMQSAEYLAREHRA